MLAWLSTNSFSLDRSESFTGSQFGTNMRSDEYILAVRKLQILIVHGGFNVESWATHISVELQAYAHSGASLDKSSF